VVKQDDDTIGTDERLTRFPRRVVVVWPGSGIEWLHENGVVYGGGIGRCDARPLRLGQGDGTTGQALGGWLTMGVGKSQRARRRNARLLRDARWRCNNGGRYG